MTMAKLTKELANALETEDYDILEDIKPEDYVFVIGPGGLLRGISFPEDMDVEDDVSPGVEDIVAFILKKTIGTTPENTTLH